MARQDMSCQRQTTHGGFGLVLARQLLQVRHLLVGRHVGVVGHGEAQVLVVLVVVLAAAVLVVLVLVLVLASVLVVVKARGSEDRGAHV